MGFFDTLYWTRRFRRRIEGRKSSRIAKLPSRDFDVPEIFVQDESDSPHNADHFETPITPIERLSFEAPEWPSPGVSPRSKDKNKTSARTTIQEILDSVSGSSSASGSSALRNRSDSIQISPSGSPTRSRTGTLHSPATSQGFTSGHSPRPSTASTSAREAWLSEALQRRPSSPGHLSEGDATSDGVGGGRSRANSTVSARDVLDVLDNSAWGESIRRSFTLRRPSENSLGSSVRGAGGGEQQQQQQQQQSPGGGAQAGRNESITGRSSTSLKINRRVS